MADSERDDKMRRLQKLYRSLEVSQQFLKPALPFINSHLTEFFASNYWTTLLPPQLREDLTQKSVDEVKDCLRDFANGNWEKYPPSKVNYDTNFFDLRNLEDLVTCCGRLRLKHRELTTSLKDLKVRDRRVDNFTTVEPLKFDVIMSAKKTHEVEILSESIAKLATAVQEGSSSSRINYLVDLGSGKGYLSSYLTLLYNFRVLAVDASSVNTVGCEKRSSKLEKVWLQLLRRAIERRDNGTPTKRGKKKNFKKGDLGDESKDVVYSDGQVSSNSGSDDNKLLKTITQFVTLECDLEELLREQFTSCEAEYTGDFGIVGLHTCGNLGVDSLKIYLANPNAKFLCNVPCCYHLLDENYLFYPEKSFMGSQMSSKNDGLMVESILKPTFPLCSVFDTGDHNRFCLGRNARMMCAYSVEKMTLDDTGLEMHPSILYRSVLQSLLKTYLTSVYEDFDDHKYKVGKIGDKCSNFEDYYRKAIQNLKLESSLKLSRDEIARFYRTFSLEDKQKLHKYYLVRSLFAPLVEETILLDRLTYLLEHDTVDEAHLIEIFDPSVSPRCHALLSWKY